MKNIFCVLLIAMVPSVLAQTKLEKAITNLENNYVQEKVYLLTDKSQYAAGDPIWFKSFVFEGYSRSTLSTTLFVELYDADKKLIDWKTILLTNGEGNGDFLLKEDLPEQVYFIRAYTPYMTNFNEDFQIVKTLPVYNPNSPKSLEISKNSEWSAKAFPEGGTFINGTPTKFAVRISGSSSFPESWTGKVIDTQNPNIPITTFKSFDKNVASFTLTPASGKKYQVIVQDNTGKSNTIDLPQVADSGLHVEINSAKEGIKYTLKGINLPKPLQNYKIVGTINNQLAYKADINPLTNVVSSLIPNKISNGTNGVLQLAIFDDQDKLIAQRLCFIKSDNLSIEKAEITDQNIRQTSRSLNSIDLSPNPYFKNYMVLVSDDDSNKPEEENILSRLWLTGDFTSKIDCPAQYFSNNANNEALDALLISETWKRFDWNSILSGPVPTLRTNAQQFLSYKLKPLKNNALLKNTEVTLALKSGKNPPIINASKTDQNGYIYLDNINFNQPFNVSLFLNPEKDQRPNADQLSFTVEPQIKPTKFNGALPNTAYQLVTQTENKELPVSISRAINTQKNNKKKQDNNLQIDEVKLTGKKKYPTKELNNQLSSGMFNTMNANIFDFVNEEQHILGSFDILDWLQGRVAGVVFKRNEVGENVPYIRGGRAKLYLDEIEVEPGMITSVPVSEIAMVKVIKQSGLINNSILIYTLRGSMASKSTQQDQKNQKISSTIVKGYDKPSEFPVEMINDNVKIEKDTRETLYWNPNLLGSNDTPPRIKFFNNDTAKQFKVTIISFDEDDRLLYQNNIFK
ncbi:hypothetical protein [Chryseobacterium pennae]|nr:hypothetical protein [Chryseobacterium pennae]